MMDVEMWCRNHYHSCWVICVLLLPVGILQQEIISTFTEIFRKF
ncbi:hypothetical protein SLEP1_g4639 [Rubroshorea leprosula]|uniref:Uncharacterized protein n=1 Tax=Rubroshorea leprosula TaxID=152421 RepID=A0AAV5HVR6_9ROSI|nr:hypothetical protein SLEP1_g4639 [Rubroshorea leprosula]